MEKCDNMVENAVKRAKAKYKELQTSGNVITKKDFFRVYGVDIEEEKKRISQYMRADIFNNKTPEYFERHAWQLVGELILCERIKSDKKKNKILSIVWPCVIIPPNP